MSRTITELRKLYSRKELIKLGGDDYLRKCLRLKAEDKANGGNCFHEIKPRKERDR